MSENRYSLSNSNRYDISRRKSTSRDRKPSPPNDYVAVKSKLLECSNDHSGRSPFELNVYLADKKAKNLRYNTKSTQSRNTKKLNDSLSKDKSFDKLVNLNNRNQRLIRDEDNELRSSLEKYRND